MEFTLHLPPPPTHQAALRILKTRDGRQFIGKMASSKAAKWCKAANLLIKSEMNRRGYHKACGCLGVTVTFYYKHTKESERESRRTGDPFVMKTTRPDLDNLAKSVLDCLVQSDAIEDDGRIFWLTLKKFYASEEKVVVDINCDSEDN